MKLLDQFANLRRAMVLIAACFVLLIAGVGGVAAMSRHFARQSTRQSETLTGNFLPGLVTLARLQEATLQLNSVTLQFALAKDDAAMKTQADAFRAGTQEISRQVEALRALGGSDESRALLDAFVAAVKTYGDAAERFQTELRGGDFEKAMASLDQGVAAGRQGVEAQLRALSEHYFKLSQGAGKTTAELIARSEKMGTLASLSLVGCSLVFVAIALGGARKVSRRLRETSQSLAESAAVVHEKSTALATSSGTLADSASKQAATLEETTAAVEEVAGSMRRIAEDSGQSKTLSESTRGDAESCAAMMAEMRTAMDEVKQSSDKTARIIKTIDEIAFQTNILALNAAVEAARAGEAGAGFAVVAEEVRALAQRSAQAAHETTGTIQDALRRTDRGVDLTRQVSTGLESMVEHSRKVNEIMVGIASACEAQNLALSQLKVGMGQINTATQSTSAVADGEAEASRSLREQAEVLTRGVDALFGAIGAGEVAKAPEMPVDAGFMVAPRPTTTVKRPVLVG